MLVDMPAQVRLFFEITMSDIAEKRVYIPSTLRTHCSCHRSSPCFNDGILPFNMTPYLYTRMHLQHALQKASFCADALSCLIDPFGFAARLKPNKRDGIHGKCLLPNPYLQSRIQQ